jgi:hypothetical protein
MSLQRQKLVCIKEIIALNAAQVVSSISIEAGLWLAVGYKYGRSQKILDE